MPAKAGIRYASAPAAKRNRRGILDSPVGRDDDVVLFNRTMFSTDVSHQRLAAGKGGRGRIVIGFRRQKHLVMRLAGRDHRKAVFKRCDAAVEQNGLSHRDHLPDGAVEIGGLGRLQSDAAEGIGELDEIGKRLGL